MADSNQDPSPSGDWTPLSDVHIETRDRESWWIADRPGSQEPRRLFQPSTWPELRSRSAPIARAVSWATAFVITLGLMGWAWTAVGLNDLCRRIRDREAGDLCKEPPAVLQDLQLVLAVAGILAGVVAVVYLVHFARTGWIWRRWRGVGMTFAGLVVAWLGVFVAGALLV